MAVWRKEVRYIGFKTNYKYAESPVMSNSWLCALSTGLHDSTLF